MLKIISASDPRALGRLLATDPAGDAALARRVAAIVADVRRGGDRALIAYARRFDKLPASGPAGAVEIPRAEIEAGARKVSRAVGAAITRAARVIGRIAKTQVPAGSRTAAWPGVVVEQRVTPLARVGCYVPGGRYPLPSSLLMTAIPARIAGVGEVIACCPRPEPAVLAAALAAGVSRLYRIGGAHAVAAMAYGTASVPRVDKIVGPGNAWVAAAKALVAKDCGIDFFAGPSEIVIVSDTGRADWIAADLVAQAEHDPDARAVLITSSKRLANAVRTAAIAQASTNPTAQASLARRGGIIVTRSIAQSVEIATAMAPEHLVVDTAAIAARIPTAGAIFVGPWSAQAAGDYATGSNHVLPTSGAARFRGGLSAADFVRVSSVQTLSQAGLRALAPTAIALAEAEGLAGHAASIRVRVAPGGGSRDDRRTASPARGARGAAARGASRPGARR
jgi:histidinol dehydrogenase